MGKYRFKKIITAILTISMISQSLLAYGSNDFWNDMQVGQLHNSLNGYESFKDINGNTVHYVGGSLTLKRSTQNYPLLWNFKPPKIEASCAGISFKGMFGTIANLDEIQKQFEEAGASFAWGVLVGIIYSLPGIGEVFTKLDAWAKKIQQMLANSCNAGISVGKSFGSKGVQKTKDWASDSFGNEFWTKADTFMKDPNDAVSKFLDCSAEIWANAGQGADCNTKKKDVQNQLSVNASGNPSIIISALFDVYKSDKSWPGPVNEGKSGVIKWDTISNYPQDDLRKIAFAALVTSTIGDVVLSKDDALAIQQNLKIINDENGAATSNKYKTAVAAMDDIIKNNMQHPLITEGKLDSDKLVKFLLLGNSVSLGDTNSSAQSSPFSNEIVKSMVVPQVGYFVSKNNGNNDVKISAYAMQSTANGDSASNNPLSADITNIINNYQGIQEVSENMYKCYLMDINASCTKVNNSLIDDDSNRFFAKVYRNTLDIGSKSNLKTLYVEYVQKNLAKAIIDKVKEYIDIYAYSLEPDVDLNYSSSTAEKDLASKKLDNTNNQSNKAEKKLKELKTKLDEGYEKLFKDKKRDLNDIIKEFKKQDIENIKKAYGSHA